MHPTLFLLLLLWQWSTVTDAKTVVITVGGNTTSSPGGVFQHQSVRADLGDIVVFNFTQGNHTATQSLFASPCEPAHLSNSTINSFDSSFRDAGNFSAITQLSYVVEDPRPVWFFDWNLCAHGGVGVINVNESSGETLAGFVRNAIRLNGTHSSNLSASFSGAYPSQTSTSKPPSSSAKSSSATGHEVAGHAMTTVCYVLPALAILVVLSL